MLLTVFKNQSLTHTEKVTPAHGGCSFAFYGFQNAATTEKRGQVQAQFLKTLVTSDRAGREVLALLQLL